MAINTKLEISDDVKNLIESKLKKELEKELDLAKEYFDKRKGEIVAGLLVSIMKTVDMRILQDRIVFEIKTL